MAFKDSKTAENLMKSFAGESQAKMRYEYSAKTAKKEGYEQISEIFTETANNEKEHAEVFFEHLLDNDMEGEAITIQAHYPVGWTEDGDATLKNLKYAADGELEEHSDLYPSFAAIAEKEGYKKIATSWKNIAKVEVEHEKRFRKLYDNIKNNMVFKRDEKVFWKCLNCGYIHEGKAAPKICPSCDHEQKYFALHVENY